MIKKDEEKIPKNVEEQNESKATMESIDLDSIKKEAANEQMEKESKPEIDGEERKIPKQKGGALKWIIPAIVIVVAIIVVAVILSKPKTKPVFSAETMLQDICEIGELSAASYSYNGVAKAYDDRGIETYYIKYYGNVEVGIHFEDIEIDIDDENKTITVQVPECEFLSDPIVDLGKAEYIFVNSAYNTETITAQAYGIAIDDLFQKASADTELFKVAKENIITSIEALTEPLIEQTGLGYQLIVK